MSARAISWALGHSETEGALRLALMVLAFATDSTEGKGRMRADTLARQATVPLESVQVALKALEGRGAIEYQWPRRPTGEMARSFAFRVLFPDDYHPELVNGR